MSPYHTQAHITAIFCAAFELGNISMKELRSKPGTRYAADVRKMIVAYLLHYTHMTDREITEQVARDRTSIYYMTTEHRNCKQFNRAYRKLWEAIERRALELVAQHVPAVPAA